MVSPPVQSPRHTWGRVISYGAALFAVPRDSGEHRPRFVKAMDRDDTAIACWSRNTKLPELTFYAVLGDGDRELRFERLLAR